MHTLESDWQEWFSRQTGITSAVHFDDVPPARYVCFSDEDGTELWRAPLTDCPSPSDAADFLPPFLRVESVTLSIRRKLLAILGQQPEHVAECAETIPEIRDAAMAVAHAPLASRRRDRVPTVFELPAEMWRQWEEILFRIDDVTAQRLAEKLAPSAS